ncbi:MAG: hypothetical protein PHF00_04865 [Elusimicrobia bacterium]|nr:hypothetical protein [Elusimicrobiota bacterium]
MLHGKMIGAALLLALACGPLRAEDKQLSAPEACQSLQAEARGLTSEALRCEAGPSALTLSGVSEAAAQTLETKLFPGKRYRGNSVILTAGSGSASQEGRPQVQLVPVAPAPALTRAVSVDFDHSGLLRDAPAEASLSGMGVLAGGPPGSSKDTDKVRKGPAGSSGEKPEVRKGPAGSSGDKKPGHQGLPGSGGGSLPPNTGSTPPSRPTPVWRNSFPPPPPNWWNTDWDYYDWWDDLPSDYMRPNFERVGENRYVYRSQYFPWTQVFKTGWMRTEDSARIVRTAENQARVHTRSLTSHVYRDVKQCYYRAIYHYDWVEGGFYGTHWKERFDHYDARCVRWSREDEPRVYTVNVAFDMSGAQSPLPGMSDLPWESDVIRVSYDGEGSPRYDLSGASYKYAVKLEDRQWSSENVTLVAGAKLRSAPESDKVRVFLRDNQGKVELVVNDDRLDFYRGETLRVNARVTRRFEMKSWGGWWNKKMDVVIYNQPLDVVVGDNPQAVVDLTSQVTGAAQPSGTLVSKSVILEEFSFSRVNSKISTDEVIRRRPGQELPY